MSTTVAPPPIAITGASLHPTYWGSLLALVLSMVVSSVSIALYGVPAYVAEYPASQRTEVFFGAMGVSFIFALRYYFLLSFNVLGSPTGDLFTLPAILKKMIYWKLAIICVLCVLLSSAIMSVRAEWSIAACVAMSSLTILTWFSCFIISRLGRLPLVTGYHVSDDVVLFLGSTFIMGILLFGIERNLGRSLPFFAFGALLVFGSGFIRWFWPALKNDWNELASALRS